MPQSSNLSSNNPLNDVLQSKEPIIIKVTEFSLNMYRLSLIVHRVLNSSTKTMALNCEFWQLHTSQLRVDQFISFIKGVIYQGTSAYTVKALRLEMLTDCKSNS